jgi:sialate O-acetylesterase
MLYYSMIAPITPLSIKGVIWYQGESNAGRAVEYREIFRRLILDWRKQFRQPELPFLFVQLANFKSPQEKPSASDWAELREAQASVLDLPNTGMVTAIDIGEASDIHPRNKQEVGRRLSMEALRIAYGRPKTHAQGPVFKSVEFQDNYAIVQFETYGRKLVNRSAAGGLNGFSISGPDQQFHWAKAEITEDDKVKVWAAGLTRPVAVRYAWADNPQPADLFDDKDLPAFPFRTDDWRLLTEGKTRN